MVFNQFQHRPLKPLLVLAHEGEARPILDTFKARKISSYLFDGTHFSVLLTTNRSKVIYSRLDETQKNHPFSTLINLGIAGSIDRGPSLYSYYEISTVSGTQPSTPNFTLQSITQLPKLDVMTLCYPHPLPQTILRGLVDEELWHLASWCATHQLHLSSVKLISDYVGDTDKKKIRENKELYGQKILDILKKMGPEILGAHF